jgi:hypothetical protein
MSKIICAKSGIPFTISHLSYTFSHRELAHPLFSLPTARLLGIIPKWYARELTPEDSTILFLALLDSSGLVEFRTHASIHISLVESNMERLSKIVHWIHAVSRPHLVFPSFAITKDSQSLSNISHWLQAWIDAKNDYEEGNRQSVIDAKIRRREEALEKLIKSHSKSLDSLAPKLAQWAAMAATFPTFSVIIDGKKQTLSDYWQSLIIKCAAKDYVVWKSKLADLIELRKHLEENLELGSLYSHSLFALIRKAIAKHVNFLDFDESTAPFTILGTDSNVESANLQSLIDNAPKNLPIESDYPNRIAYILAKSRYETAQRHLTRVAESSLPPIPESTPQIIEPEELVDDSLTYGNQDGIIDLDSPKDSLDDSLGDSSEEEN